MNNTQNQISIDVLDQLPIAQDKEILVKAISPVFKGDKAEAFLDDESKIKWQIILAPGEQRELPVSFMIEYPSGRQLNGL